MLKSLKKTNDAVKKNMFGVKNTESKETQEKDSKTGGVFGFSNPLSSKTDKTQKEASNSRNSITESKSSNIFGSKPSEAKTFLDVKKKKEEGKLIYYSLALKDVD